MIDHAAWVRRLERLKPPVQDIAASALPTSSTEDVVAMLAGLRQPALLVFPMATKAAGNVTTTVMTQRVAVRAGVAISVKHLGSKRGGGALDQLLAVHKAVAGALQNWRPDGFEPVEYEQGNLLDFSGGTLLWLDQWRTAYQLQNGPSA